MIYKHYDIYTFLTLNMFRRFISMNIHTISIRVTILHQQTGDLRRVQPFESWKDSRISKIFILDKYSYFGGKGIVLKQIRRM